MCQSISADFLIIGQGLSGSLLAWTLIQRGSKIVIIDNGQDNASKVAAGLINPITGMRFAKASEVDFLLPAAKTCYRQLENFFQQAFYHQKPMLRVFRNQHEAKNCQKRLTQKNYQPYLSKYSEPASANKLFVSSFGAIEQLNTGFLDTRGLLNSLTQFFIGKACYLREQFDYSELDLGKTARWRHIRAKWVIFCEGHQLYRNPWFNWLPWQALKGEILTLRHQVDFPDSIINFGHWLIPCTQNTVRLGASFQRDCLDSATTTQAKDHLLRSLAQLAPAFATSIHEHQAGIRLCTIDRQPFIGSHPLYRQLAIFNGFGAKGSLQIPWYASHFADALMQEKPLLKTCSIQRFSSNVTG
jgi:glycine/D-amino acid oxidase-like deaminating enzyme